MKNTLPLILAVLLGLAAVFSVNRTLARSSTGQEKNIQVVVATHELSPSSTLGSGDCGTISIRESALIRGRHIEAADLPRIEGQSVVRRIAKDSPIFWNDLDIDAGGPKVGKGEFLVDIRFQNSPLVSRLKEHDEIAIAALQTIDEPEERRTTNENVPTRFRRVQRLSVLFPRVKVHSVENGTVFVSVPPEKALQLQMAALSFQLYPFLRRKDDNANDRPGVGGSVSGADLTVDKLKLGAEP